MAVGLRDAAVMRGPVIGRADAEPAAGRGRSARRRETILVIKHGAFGDIVQSEGALRDLRAHFPDAVLTVLTTPPFRPLFERCPSIDHVVTDERQSRWRLDRMLALRSRLRALGVDRVFDFQNSGRSAAYRRWIFPGLPWSDEGLRRDWLFRLKPPPLSSLERFARQLAAAGVPVQHTRTPDASWLADDVGELLRGAGVTGRYVTLVPGASAAHPGKRWPFYPALAAGLWKLGLQVVFAPGPAEANLAAALPAIDLTARHGRLSWFELAGVLKGSTFVVGNDTGPTHLAAHCGVPGLALFGPHFSPERTGILRDNFAAIAVPDLRDLPVERVLAHVEAHVEASLAGS